MADKKKPLMQQAEGVEFGYFAKRKEQFNAELEQGFKGTKPKGKPQKGQKKT